MSENLEKIINNILEVEGGYTEDVGGATKYGITLPTYKEYLMELITENTIKKLEVQQAKEFYKWLFNKHSLDKVVNYQVANLIFDSIVNHGAKPVIVWIQEIAGITVDGIMGDMTIGEINKAPKKIYYSLINKRISLYTSLSLSKPDVYSKYLKGWMNRIAKFIIEL